MNIKEAIQNAIDIPNTYSKVCKVTAVDASVRTCDVTPIDGDAPLTDVRLQAALSGNTGWLLLPTVGSDVVVTFITDDLAFVSMTSQVSEIIAHVNNTQLKIDASGFVIENGGQSLKAILNDLIAAIQRITVTTPVGPSGTPINAVEFDLINQRLNQLFQ